MKKRFLFLITMLIMTLLVTVGCTKEDENPDKITSSIQEKMVLDSSEEDSGNDAEEIDVRFGIAEEAYLENLHKELKEKGLYKDGLKYVRFYNYDGSVVAVYSLTKDGELYIDETPARLLLN